MIEKNKIKRKRKYFSKTTKKILAIIVIFAIIGLLAYGFAVKKNKTIKVTGAFALYPMMNIWAENYQTTHTDITIEVSAGGAGKGMSDAIRDIVDIGMVSREIYQEEINQGVFWISVAKDGVVATINKENPVINYILTKGLKKEQLTNIFIKGNITTWGDLVGDPTNNDPIRVYTRADACGAAETWAKYLGNYTQDDYTKKASGVNGDPGLAGAIKSDKLGIGYNNINFAYDSNTKKPFDGLKIIPLDLNEDGLIDEDNESFYDTLDDIVNAIANDKYPSPPARALYLVTKDKFTGLTKDFIYWILTDGQQYVSQSGYIQLSEETITKQLEYLEQGSRPPIS